MPVANAQWVANGNITPSRFVQIDTTIDNRVIQSVAGSASIGVSQVGTRRPPYGGLNDGYAAIAGETLRVFQQGEVAPLEVGASVTRGARLKSDLNGRGITAAAGDSAYAIALENGGALGVIIDVIIISDTVGAS